MSLRTLVIIPTYNERDNLPLITSRLFEAFPEANLLVVDDGSPDGTGELADTMALDDERVHTLHRSGKLGLGSAYIQGFQWGLERGYEVLVEMDADGSHPASVLPSLVAAIEPADRSGSTALAIGSRWTPGGTVVDWPRSREALSRGANLYARIALGIDIRDATAGFRAYRADVLKAMDLGSVNSYGYCFQIDMALRVLSGGHRVVEIPIEFRDRELGESKMSRAIVLEAMWKVTQWGVERRSRQLARAVGGRSGRR